MTYPRPRQRGLTLVEVMIALMLMAFMATSVLVVMRNSADIQETVKRQTELSAMGRGAMERMRRELSQAWLSRNTTEFYRPVFKAEDRDPIDEIYFVAKAHRKLYPDVKESLLAEFGYTSESLRGSAFRTLMHREAPTIDEEPEKGGMVLAMCHNVREFNLRFYDPKKEEWVDEWDSEASETLNRLPRAIEIRLELEDDHGNVEAFFTRTLVNRENRQ